MRRFWWCGDGWLDPSLDLRPMGWRYLGAGPPAGTAPDCLVLADRDHALEAIDPPAPPEGFQWFIATGVASPAERALLLAAGVGEAVGRDLTLDELHTRAARVVTSARAEPQVRRLGRLRLELLPREGFVGDTALGLHPREFLLLWRLMQSPGQLVTKAVLLRDVWRIDYAPETNSVAVHASRLRAKLALAGLGGVLVSGEDGGYRLRLPAGGDSTDPSNDLHGRMRRRR